MTDASRPSFDERLDAARADLDRELARIVDSGQYADWFRRMSQFHRYSPTNAMWLMAQQHARGDETSGRVASYRTWQQLDRQVRKGERGLMVFHPRPYWIDPTDGRKVAPPTTAAARSQAVRKVRFGVGYVFAESQTEGAPLPELGRPAPDVAPTALANHLDQYCDDHRITVEYRDLNPGLFGFYQRDGDRIVLARTNSHGEHAATLAHELAHREDPKLIAAHVAGDRGYYHHNRADCEAVAEATAHTISARFGFDLTEHSAGYIAGWVRGDLDRFKELHERVGTVARSLLPQDRLDRTLEFAHARSTIEAARRRSDRTGAGRTR